MKILLSLFAAIAITIFYCGCNTNSLEEESKNYNDTIKVIAVLCDVTKSTVDPNTSQSIQKVAIEIFDSYSNGIFLYKPVFNSDYNAIILKFTKRTLEDANSVEEAEYSDSISACYDTLKKNLNFYSSKPYDSTCITLALKHIYNEFNNYKKIGKPCEFRLFVLSDMIEDCARDDDFGKIQFVNDETYRIASDKISSLQIKPLSKYNLKFLGVKPYLIFQSINDPAVTKQNSHGRQTSINQQDLITSWTMILKRFGYSEDDITFDQQKLPPNIHN